MGASRPSACMEVRERAFMTRSFVSLAHCIDPALSVKARSGNLQLEHSPNLHCTLASGLSFAVATRGSHAFR